MVAARSQSNEFFWHCVEISWHVSGKLWHVEGILRKVEGPWPGQAGPGWRKQGVGKGVSNAIAREQLCAGQAPAR
jgi:hypothetical protein